MTPPGVTLHVSTRRTGTRPGCDRMLQANPDALRDMVPLGTTGSSFDERPPGENSRTTAQTTRKVGALQYRG